MNYILSTTRRKGVMIDESITIALISNDKVGSSMAGPGIRYFEMAQAMAKHFKVRLFVPNACDIKHSEIEIITYDSHHASSSISAKLNGCDYVIAQSLRPRLLAKVKSLGIRYVADLYDPLAIEVLEYTKYDSLPKSTRVFEHDYQSLVLQLHTADHILCASEKQKDYYIGALSALKLITPRQYRQSTNPQDMISLVPFGISSLAPVAHDPKAMEKKFPTIKPTDKVIYWGGGIWNWFDPLSVIKAIELISKSRQDIKLFFLGVKHPNPKIKDMEMAQTALDYCREHDLLDKFVFFNFGWTPYAERADYLLRSTVAISAHLDSLETRFSFRTRILGYLWAELPMVLTQGDVLADLVKTNNLGKVVASEDIRAIAASITELIDDAKLYETIKNNIRSTKKNFYWENVIATLVDVIQNNKIKHQSISRFRFAWLSYKYLLSGLKKKLFNKL